VIYLNGYEKKHIQFNVGSFNMSGHCVYPKAMRFNLKDSLTVRGLRVGMTETEVAKFFGKIILPKPLRFPARLK